MGSNPVLTTQKTLNGVSLPMVGFRSSFFLKLNNMEKKQTAVQWLINEHFGCIENCTPDFRNKIQQALEMEKQEMLEFGSKITERWGMCKVEPHFIKNEFDKFYKSE